MDGIGNERFVVIFIILQLFVEDQSKHVRTIMLASRLLIPVAGEKPLEFIYETRLCKSHALGHVSPTRDE